MTAKRVVFVSHTASMSGAEKVMLTLADAAVAAGYDVLIASPTGPLSGALPPGVGHVPLPALGLTGAGSGVRRVIGAVELSARWIRSGVRLRRYTNDAQTRIVVNSLFALPALRATGRVRCCTWLAHDTIVESKQRWVVRFSAKSIRRAVAVSQATAAPLRGKGFDVEVAYNGVPIRAGVGSRRMTDVPHVIGVLAKLTPWKGQHVLLEAATLVPDVDVEFAGDSFPGDQPYVDRLHRIAASPELAGRVRFLGHASAEDCLARWTALISPSVSPEAGPLGVLEAMSFGCAVIGTDHGGTAEYLADGVGALVPPGDAVALAEAISKVVHDEELRSTMSALGRKRVADQHDDSQTTPRMLHALLSD